uniref:Retroviral polymerase SH3-like domain-containing protein n=1 Tax=Tanacetum cinerariifolium TaxID=118510 RepID=A0A6L2KYU4_TANCI|nr:hypothetical protein [Tanacetum cinerariifolium]
MEHADTLCDIVEQVRAQQPLDSALDYAFMYTTRTQELSVYLNATCPSSLNKNEKLVTSTPMNKIKKVRFQEPKKSTSNTPTQADSQNFKNINKSLLTSIGVKSPTSASGSSLQAIQRKIGSREHLVATRRIKSGKSNKKKDWKPKCKVFTNVGYRWIPTRRTLTIDGNKCPLTRFTSTTVVPSKKIVLAKALKKTIPSRTDRPLVFRLGLLQAHDQIAVSAHQFGQQVYSKDVGKLKPKADIGIFICYSPVKKAYRVYNKRTHLIMETIYVEFDELTKIAFEQFGPGPELQLTTLGTISSGLPPSVLSRASPATTTLPNPVDKTSTPSSTLVHQDAPSASTSLTLEDSQEPVLHQDVKRDEFGGILKNKARLVAKGFRQEEGIDFEKSFAAMSTMGKMSFLDYKFLKVPEASLLTSQNMLYIIKKYDMESSDSIDTYMVDITKLDEDLQAMPLDPTRYRESMANEQQDGKQQQNMLDVLLVPIDEQGRLQLMIYQDFLCFKLHRKCSQSDQVLRNLKFPNKGAKYPVFGMTITMVMMNDEIKASADYADYLAKFKGGKLKGRGGGLVTKKGVENDLDSKEKEEEDEIPLKAKKASKRDFILQQRPKGLGEGSGVTPTVPDRPSQKGPNEGSGVTPIVLDKPKDGSSNPKIIGGPATQTTILQNAAFQTDDLDAYDLDCDDISSAKAVLMANLSSYDSGIVSEQTPIEDYLDNEITNLDNGLHTELNEVKTVFNQMEVGVKQCSIGKNILIFKRKNFFLDNDRLLKHIICHDVMNIVMHTDSISENLFPVNNNKCLVHDNLEIEQLEQENDHLFELLLSQDIVHIYVNSLATRTYGREMQQSFINVYHENLVPKAELAKKENMVEKKVLNEIALTFEDARALIPLDNDLDSACKCAKQIQEVLVYVTTTCPSLIKPSEKLVAIISLNKNKKLSEDLGKLKPKVDIRIFIVRVVAAQRPADSTGIPLSTSVDQATSYAKPSSEESSSRDFITTNVHSFNQSPEHLSKWTCVEKLNTFMAKYEAFITLNDYPQRLLRVTLRTAMYLLKSDSYPGCTLLREKLEEDLVTYFQNIQNTFESSDGSTNVVNAPREPFVVKQDHGVNPPHIDECCCECGEALDGIFCQQCTCKSCGKGAHIGYNCPPTVPIIFNPKPCNQTMNNEPPQTLPSFDPTCYFEKENSLPCVSKPNLVDQSPNVFNPSPQPPIYSCEFCGSNAQYGHYCIPQVPFIYLEPGYSQDFNSPKFNRYSFFKMQKVLLLAWDRVFEIKDAFGNKQYKPEDIQELFRKLLDDLQNIHKELAEFINSPGWNRPAVYDDDDDDDDVDYTIAITPVLSTEEPDNSLSMGDEHLETIPAMESDGASPHDSEVVSLEVAEIVIPEDEEIEDDKLQISSGSTTTQSDISLPEYDLFIFDLSNDQFPPTDRSDFTHEEFGDEPAHIISPPEYDCFYFRNLPDLVEDDHSPLLAYAVRIFLAYLTYPVIPPYLHSFRNEDTIFDPDIIINHFYSFKPGLSHRCGTFKKFNTHHSHLNESLMEMLFSTLFPMDQ